ncbi:aspartate aminotransferase family protein [Nocardiopsis sp. MG754419]|uniref:aspartate aminotransferase family protein n=1 Tax=Nocardiopsis sp. MG754419 TaxID=2259865 RepID=UPI001BA4F42E|nr:aminotransferase class III-fold pyridoxal phosphate-dependent enzyme [Nocardiopsis sp. MG754419]MBR8740607.1 aspartate aminotransferase family protein [Nocardiopsis sp. MG754419]
MREPLELIRTHQSSGRSFLHTIMGAVDPEVAGKGQWITSRGGHRYLDVGSFGVFLLGHGHPGPVGAVARQMDLLAGASRTLPGEVNARAAAALAAVAPAGLSKVLLLNSGSEAVEAALKLARARTGRTPLAHLSGSFHGKSTGALSLTDAEAFRRGIGPLLPDVVRIPRDDAAAAAALIERHRPAAVFAEPVQGEGGMYPLAPVYAAVLREACTRTGSLLVFDEIQSGLGRCGTFWAHEDLGVRPDILLSGKALGGGVMPASAVIATEDAFRPFDVDPLLHTSTFGGNPLASAAILGALDVIGDLDVPARVRRAGAALRAILTGLVAHRPGLFSSVTGRGLMLGLHCRKPEVAAEMMRESLAGGVLLTMCLTTPTVLRCTPSAFIDAEERGFLSNALHSAAVRVERESA